MTLEWNNNLLTGIAEIDNQHKLLFELINKLGNKCSSKTDFFNVYAELQAFVGIHFKTEENYMRYLNYPEYETHKGCHDNFVYEVKLILKNKISGDDFSVFSSKLVETFENWLMTHYTDEDVKMAEYIKSCHYEHL